MQALVVYESMYGNTHAVAERIADGLRPEFDVEVVPVGRATDERLAAADLVVVGGPTHAQGIVEQRERGGHGNRGSPMPTSSSTPTRWGRAFVTGSTGWASSKAAAARSTPASTCRSR